MDTRICSITVVLCILSHSSVDAGCCFLPPPSDITDVRIDTIVAVDYSLYSFFNETDGDGILATREFVSQMFREVNFRLLNLLHGFQVSLQAIVRGIYIPQTPEDSPDVNQADPSNTDPYLFREWLMSQNPQDHDMSVLMTRNPIFTNGVETRVAFIPGQFCDTNASLITKTYGFETSLHIVWAILFKLGANATGINGRCETEEHDHIMDVTKIGTFNQPWHFHEDCTFDEIQSFMDDIHFGRIFGVDNCLSMPLDDSAGDLPLHPPFRIFSQPGQLYSPDQLCSFSFGGNVSCSETVPDGECGYIYCNTGNTTCEQVQNPLGGRCTFDAHGVQVNGICLGGECVAEHSPYYHCDRLGQECAPGPRGTCGGAVCLTCRPWFKGYDCSLLRDAEVANNTDPDCGCSDGSTCYNTSGSMSCHCQAPFYGQKCNMSRYSAWPGANYVTIIINPKGIFEGIVEILDAPDLRECYFSRIDTPLEGFSDEHEGFFVQLPYDSPCADILIRRQVSILIRYDPLFVTGLDEIVTITFDHDSVLEFNLTTANISTRFVDDGRKALNITNENINNAFPVALQLQDRNGAPVTQTEVGDIVVLTVTLNPLSDYTSLRLLSLDAGPSTENSNQIRIVEDGCRSDARYFQLLREEAVYQEGTFRLFIRVFRITPNNTVSFAVTVRICGSFVEDRCEWRNLECYSDQGERRKRSVSETESSTSGVQERKLQATITVLYPFTHRDSAQEPRHGDGDIDTTQPVCPQCLDTNTLDILMYSLGFSTGLLLVACSVLLFKVIVSIQRKQ